MLWLLFIPFAALAQEAPDLKAIRELDESLPDYNVQNEAEADPVRENENRRFIPPGAKVSFESIRESGTETVYIQEGKPLIRIRNDKKSHTASSMTVKVYRLPDESGFKYILSEDSKMRYKIHFDDVTPIRQELVLYEPPHRYTPAPPILIKEFDRSLALVPEASFYAGFVRGDFMKDLFNESNGSGFSQQYGLHAFTEWKLPVKIGGVLHYETATYNAEAGGKIYYSSFSFGPQFKSRDFHLGELPFRFQTQFRYGPLARARSESTNTEQNFKFASTDFLTSLEIPIVNRFGSFVLGAFVQYQWLNIKDQSDLVSVTASSASNKSLGISFSQVWK